jgi:hypothetical protein
MGLSTPSGGGGAPTDAEYVTGSSNSELSNETVVSPAGDILTSGSFGSTVSLSPGFGTFTQVSADNPALLTVEADARTNGGSSGRVKVRVDESGGTTADFSFIVAFAHASKGSGGVTFSGVTVPIPAGAQFEIFNKNDPTGDNAIRFVRAQIITP